MSSSASKGCNERRLLTKVQHTIHPATLHSLEPVVVPFFRSRASVTLAFDKTTGGHPYLHVSLRDVKAPNMALQFEATVEWYPRPLDGSLTMDRSKWGAPERPVKVVLDGEGRIGSFFFRTLRALTVDLEVYAVDGCSCSALLGGLNALRLDKAPPDEDLKEGGEEVPARRGLNSLRLEKTLTDVALKVDGEVFPAHRNVLAANSPAFRSMFTSDLKEAPVGVVEIEGASPTAFGLFLEFLYTANLDDWKGCELELLELADRYQVGHLTAACEQRLLDMDWSTALGILQHANTKPSISSDMRRKAMRVVVENWGTDFQASDLNLTDAVRLSREFFLSVAKKK